MKDPRQITPAEFQIMEALWRGSGEQSVRDVLKVIQRHRKVAYTTVMTLLGKLADKGSVVRSRRGKAYFYRPAVRRDETLDFLIQEFADAYCGGDRSRLAQAGGSVASPGPRPKRPLPASSRDGEEAEMDVALL